MMNQNEFIGPVNLGNPVEKTINELAKKVIGLTNLNSQIEYKSLPHDDPVQRQPDISLAHEKLGWEPRIKIDDGMMKTINYFKKLLKN